MSPGRILGRSVLHHLDEEFRFERLVACRRCLEGCLVLWLQRMLPLPTTYKSDVFTADHNDLIQEEPYKLTLFGKSRSKMEVVAADFLPSDGQLYIAVVDAHCDMHILQYDPERMYPPPADDAPT